MAGSPGFPLTAGGPIDGQALAEHWREWQSAPSAASKVTTLADAVRESVRPRDAVYLGGSLARPNAAAFEPPASYTGPGRN